MRHIPVPMLFELWIIFLGKKQKITSMQHWQPQQDFPGPVSVHVFVQVVYVLSKNAHVYLGWK